MAAEHERCFWLDGGGARRGPAAGRSLGWLDEDDVSLTYDAARGEVVRHRGGAREVVGDDVFAALEAEAAGDGPDVHWVGYLGYASRPDLPALVDPADPMPTAVWMRTTHVRRRSSTRSRSRRAGWRRRPTPVATRRTVPEDYAAAFADVQEQLRAGNSYEVNLTHRLTVHSDLDPVAAYLRLRASTPRRTPGSSSTAGRLAAQLVARALRDRRPAPADRDQADQGHHRPRRARPRRTTRLRDLLATDPKFRAENLMIVDLLRNDIGMVGEVGSVEVPVLMDVESYPSVHQLVSTVRGVLRDDVTTVGALRALFPAGSMTGAPKLRTMEVIRDVEATARGVYAGAFGWISGDGRADLGVVIRSLTTAGDGTWTLGTGGGITVRSDVDEEYAESRWKAERLLRVFDADRRATRRGRPSRRTSSSSPAPRRRAGP